MTICIRYASERWSDGAGAQIQRIAAIYSISREFKINFLNSQIKHIESNPGDGFISLEDKNEFISRLNHAFRIESHFCNHEHQERDLKYSKVMKFRTSTRLYFLVLRVLTGITNQHILYNCTNPYLILENYPDIYRHFTTKFGKSYRTKSQNIDIQLHVRGNKKGNELMNSRHVDVQWYIEIMRILDKTLKKLQLNYSVTIHTDAPKGQTNWKPLDISADTERFWKSANVMDSKQQINLEPIDFLREFDFVDELNIVRDIDPILAWELMSSADVLITGRSSFSFIGALMNVDGLKIAPEFKHKYPGAWLVQKTELPLEETIGAKFSDFLQTIKIEER